MSCLCFERMFILAGFLLLCITSHVTSQCAIGQFQCTSSGECIDAQGLCNGIQDCHDDPSPPSDEVGCHPQFECTGEWENCPTSGVCIAPLWRCDGGNDCGDSSDEDVNYCLSKTCPDTLFQCEVTKRCLSPYALCDKKYDCSNSSAEDSSDEPPGCLTGEIECPAGSFKCNNSRCVELTWICDGEDDCGDGSDEGGAFSCDDHSCGEDYFTCHSPRPGSKKCIDLSMVCDGLSQCETAEDEHQECDRRPCERTEYRCGNGLCILLPWLCDHDNDCGDATDEGSWCVYPSCDAFSQFTCKNGRCISRDDICDGYNDCRDNSDEEECDEPTTCASGEFPCEDDKCISDSFVCDGKVDCIYDSDEFQCGINECDDPSKNNCDHKCTDELTSFSCACNGGYRLGDDGHTCQNIDECSETPSVCNQRCIDLDGSYTCKCLEGYKAQDQNQVTCQHMTGGEPFLTFANRYYVRRSGTQQGDQDSSILVHDFDFVVALDVDTINEKIYFSDVVKGKVYIMNFDGSDVKDILLSGVPDVEGLAVDWIGRKLYFTDRFYDVLQVCELDGSERKTLLREYLVEPRGVVVHPKVGYVFWADWGLNSYIGRLGMNGSDFLEIHGANIVWPNGLTIDYTTDKLYWTDASLDHLAFSNLDGSYMHEFLNDDNRHLIAHPFGITVFEDQVYWTDWNEKKIFKAHKFTGNDITVVQETIHRPMGIVAIHRLRQDTTIVNPCANNTCSHLCLLAPGGGHTCACPDNYFLEEDGTCSPACTNIQIHCPLDDICIPFYWGCDGKRDCTDNTDEFFCPDRVCPVGLHQCQNQQCIYQQWLCDGDNDCMDNSDEFYCHTSVCSDWEFQCNNGRCIPQTKVCNLRNDCLDLSDEKAEVCQSRTCAPGLFACDNGYCITESWFCDLDNDCGDNSDEPHAVCQAQTCRDGWFHCRTNYRCIPSYMRCNGRDECRDNSDEEGCHEVTCDPLGEYRCDNHRCIPNRWYCDFENDCGDFSDEPSGCEPRACSESEFRCSNKRCIRGFWKCNGNNDCGDGSDESDVAGCNSVECPTDQVQCLIGGCISRNLTCNRLDDCSDGSDEFNCSYDCFQGYFQCENSRCIPENDRCDGDDDCGDGSDETQDVCREVPCDPANHFMCANGICVRTFQRCDGIDNCGDGSDENCPPPHECAKDDYICRNGICIDKKQVCDLNNDCSDGSDESGCISSGSCALQKGGCETNCTDLENGYICHCAPGYYAVGQNCQDVDECEANPCIHLCFNTKGFYQCACAEGYTEIVSNGLDCRSEDGDPTLIFGDGQEIRKYTNRNDTYEVLVQREGHVESLDYMPHGNTATVYFVDSFYRSIKRIGLDADISVAPDHLGLDNIYRPRGIAIDWVSGLLYFTDLGRVNDGYDPLERRRRKRAVTDARPKIAVAQLDGSQEKNVISGENVYNPIEIALNPPKGKMYWIDLGPNQAFPAIRSAWMNGANQQTLITKMLLEPTGLTIDFANNDTVYWCDAKKNTIEYMFSDGSGRTILKAGNLLNPFKLEVFESYIYWTTRLFDVRGKVMRINKLGHGENETYLEDLNKPTGLKIYNRLRYPTPKVNPCLNKPCSHLCLLTGEPPMFAGKSSLGFVCACPAGINLRPRSSSQCDIDEVSSPTTTKVISGRPSKIPCRNGGTKTASGDCRCADGYSGDSCSTEQGFSASHTTVITLGSVIVVVLILLLVLSTLLFLFMRKRSKRPSEGGAYYTSSGIVLDSRGNPEHVSSIQHRHPSQGGDINPNFPPPVGAVGGLPEVPEYADPLSKKDGNLEKDDLRYNIYIPPELLPRPLPMEPPPAYTPHEHQYNEVDLAGDDTIDLVD